MRPFLTATWRYLLMLNYEVDPAVLRPLVPRGTELDAWQGRTFASMVGFRFLDTRVRGLAVPFHRDFDEVNLRFYVRRLGPEGWRRGVVFVREVVPRLAIATVARVLYNEPYVACPMRHAVTMDGADTGAPGHVEYAWKSHGRWHQLSARTLGAPAQSEPGSQEEFITEHYWATPPSATAAAPSTAWSTRAGASGAPRRPPSTATSPASTAPPSPGASRARPTPPSWPPAPKWPSFQEMNSRPCQARKNQYSQTRN
ncbi:YqjF family protein [Corallococcus sp. 4LFB]|uniref:YqjF family protein n=1 Tax=Corallococcus sp. 4LFB TaxID=3383249 RepID=UPI0039762226